MTETNGWRGEPGVPMNPEKDDWHWLKTPDGLQVPYEWRAAGKCERGRWPNYWVPVHDDNWQAMECTYLGPCLTPDEATALQARVAELEKENEIMADLIDVIGNAFNGAGKTIFAEIAKARAALEGKKDV